MKRSKSISTIGAITTSGLLFVFSAIIFWSGIVGLNTGETATLGRGHHFLVLRQESPIEFWCWVGLRFVVSILILCIVFYLLRGATKKQIK